MAKSKPFAPFDRDLANLAPAARWRQWTQRRGLGGQAKSMRGEPNSIGVATRRDGDMVPDAFFADGNLNRYPRYFRRGVAPALQSSISRKRPNSKPLVTSADHFVLA
jgi:hypothetical protein